MENKSHVPNHQPATLFRSSCEPSITELEAELDARGSVRRLEGRDLNLWMLRKNLGSQQKYHRHIHKYHRKLKNIIGIA